jgi:predicted RNase H-like nuclease (RuvC/YqgF family)
MDTIITAAFFSFISTIIGYFVGIRKNNAEISNIEIKNIKEVITIYTETIQELKNEVGELKEEIKEYKSCISKLENELHQFKTDMKKPNTSFGGSTL